MASKLKYVCMCYYMRQPCGLRTLLCFTLAYFVFCSQHSEAVGKSKMTARQVRRYISLLHNVSGSVLLGTTHTYLNVSVVLSFTARGLLLVYILSQISRAAMLTKSTEGAPEYLLYYKRATAYYSAGRYASALADFDQVLSLTNDTFDKANLMKARIFTKEGRFAEARDALRKYTVKVKGDSGSQEVMMAITEGELANKKISQAVRAKLWQACVEAATIALATASHSAKLRQQRADCSIAAGDIEGAAADLS